MPLYTAAEAARFLHLPTSTVRAWAFGQGDRAKHNRFESVIEAADRKAHKLSFVNLVELLVLAAIRRKHNVPLPQVRRAMSYLRKQFPSPHPLADNDFQTYGADLFVERFGKLLNISRDGQFAIKQLIQDYLQLVERDTRGVPVKLHLPSAYKTTQERGAVVINPNFGFGRPVLDGRGVRVEVILDRFRAGEPIASLAEDYSITEDVIEEIIRNEIPLAA